MLNETLLIAAFVQGILTFFAPCAVALLPGYLSRFINKKNVDNDKSKVHLLARALYLAFFTVLGISTIYLVFGALLIIFKETFKPFITYMSVLLGVIVIILGIMMMMGKSIALNIHAKKTSNNESLESYLFGFGYGIAALGCLFPFFLVLATAALSADTNLQSAIYFATYAFGMALMMITFYIIALFSKTWLQKTISKIMPKFTRISGLIIFLSGIYIIWYQSILFL
jgi:cytochrome c biogenesis protein CcdA